MANRETLQNIDFRDLLSLLFGDSVKFDSFVQDFFTDTYKRFSIGMDTQQKINLLFGDAGKHEIIVALQRMFSPLQLNAAIEKVFSNARRKANPSLFERAKDQVVHKKFTLILSVLFIVTFAYGDTATWRSRAVPLVMAYINRDPSSVLEGALADFKEQKYKQALDKANCVMLMPSANEDQKREASIILLSISRVKTDVAISNLETASLTHGKLPDRIDRIHRIVAHNTPKSIITSVSQLSSEETAIMNTRSELWLAKPVQDAGVQDVEDVGIQVAAEVAPNRTTHPLAASQPTINHRGAEKIEIGTSLNSSISNIKQDSAIAPSVSTTHSTSTTPLAAQAPDASRESTQLKPPRAPEAPKSQDELFSAVHRICGSNATEQAQHVARFYYGEIQDKILKEMLRNRCSARKILLTNDP